MKRILMVLMIAALAAPAAFADRRIVPLAGHLPGANGTQWTTDLSLANPGTQPQEVTLVFHPGGGAEWTRTVSLGANESALLADVVDPAFFPGSPSGGWLGQLEIVSAFRLKASARIFTGSASGAGTYGTTYESFDPDGLPSRGVLTGLVSSQRFRSNVAFANGSDDPVSIHFEVRRADGSAAGSDDVVVAGHESVQQSIAGFVVTADDSALSLEWSSNHPAIAAGSVIDQSSGDPTDLPSVDDAGTDLLFPSIGKFPGANGTFWTTSLALSADSPGEDAVELEFHDAGGATSRANLTIPGRGSFRSDDVFALLGLPGGSGILQIHASEPTVAVARIFNTRADGSTAGLSVLPQKPDDASTHIRVSGVRRDSQFRLNVSITNTGADSSDGVIRLRDDRGNQVESQSFHVSATTTSQFFEDDTTSEVESGEVEVEVEHGHAVTGMASIVDNRSGDATVSHGEDSHQQEQEVDFAYAPANPGVGATVRFTASAGSAGATYAWNFGDGASGSGATAAHSYAAAGEYLVRLTATFAGGVIVQKSEDVTVGASAGGGNAATGIDFSWTPASFTVGSPVTFTATFTGTPAAGAIVKWSFPGGLHMTGNPVTFTFTTAEPEDVEVELEQEGHLTLSATHVVTVGGGQGGGGATAVDFSWNPASPSVGSPVTFTATFTGTPASGAVVRWSFPGGVHMTGNPVTFTFTTAEPESVEVELEQEGHATLSATHIVTVGGGQGGGGATAVDFSWNPASPSVGSPVTFTATFTGTPASGAVVKWSFPHGVHATGNPGSYTFTSAESEDITVELEQPGRVTLSRTHTVTAH